MATEKATSASYESLFAASETDNNQDKGTTATGAPRQRRKRTENVVAITKGQLIDLFAFANMGVALSPYNAYQLDRTEIEALADSWLAVIKEHPSIGKYLVVGKKLGVWGNLFFVHYSIIARRMNVNVQQAKAGPARPSSGPERNGQDNARAGASIIP